MRTRAARAWTPGCILGLLVSAALILLSGTYLWLYADHAGPTRVSLSRPAEAPALPPYSLSADQQRLVDELGYPDSFTLLFYQELDDEDYPYDVRFECWHYVELGRDISFVNGAKVRDESTGAPERQLVAAPYRPEQFTAAMYLGEVLGSAGITEYVRAAADPALVASGEVYLARQLAFGMKAGRLVAVQTLPLEMEG